MATTETTPAMGEAKLLTLPIELQLEIICNLSFLDKQLFRSTNRHFHVLIPAPTQAEWREAEELAFAQKRGLLYCNPCNKLRPTDSFSTKMQRTNCKRNKGGKFSRFCIECGSRPQNGTAEDIFKYHLGNRWEHHGVFFVKCARCTRSREAEALPKSAEVGW